MAGYECPTCGASFDTQRGRGVHHVRVHGERLPNRTCGYCEGAFYAASARRYCSRACLLDSGAYAGENQPNYQGGKQRTECELCGAAFEYYPSEKRGLYCAACVETRQWRTLPALSGGDNPRWSGGKDEEACDVCGTIVTRYPSGFGREVVLCGDECRSQWLSEAFSGAGHPNWEGGGNEPYGRAWAAARRRALERDGYACVVCGKSKGAIGRNPDVHHIVPLRAFIETDVAAKTDAHALRNLVTLCVRCHRRADFGRPSKAELKQLVANQA